MRAGRDLAETGRLLYFAGVDASALNGPGINEREFILEIQRRFGPRATFVVPKPAQLDGEISGPAFRFGPGFSRQASFRYVLFQLQASLLVLRLSRSERYDLLVLRLGQFPVGQAVVARLSGVPYVIKTLGSGVVDALPDRGGLIWTALGALNRRLVRTLVTGARVIDVCTTGTATYLARRLAVPPERFVWVDNATDTNRFRPADARQAKVRCGLDRFDQIIGFAGTIPTENGIPELIQILPRMLRDFPGLGVVVIGGNPSETVALEKQAADLGVSDQLVLVGKVPYPDLPEWLAAFDVGVNLNTAPLAARVGNAGQKIRQYLASGRPVLSGPGGNDFLVSADVGSIVNPTDLEAIEAALRSWLRRCREDGEGIAQRAAAYARQNLSIAGTVSRRLNYWMDAL